MKVNNLFLKLQKDNQGDSTPAHVISVGNSDVTTTVFPNLKNYLRKIAQKNGFHYHNLVLNNSYQ